MSMKIVADSSSDVLALSQVDFASAPLKIITSQKEYVDTEDLNVEEMVEELLHSNERSQTACPGVGDWLEGFGEATEVFCVTITSALSGSYNAACVAREEYEREHPERRVHVIDTLSTGPEMKLIIEKLCSLIGEGKTFEEICEEIDAYSQHTGLIFMLESLRNLANNGRVSRLAAGAVGILGIRVIGKADEKGELEQLAKSRGERNALPTILSLMKKEGYQGGKVRISHCCNPQLAQRLADLIGEHFPEAETECYSARGLCSFYAEKGGLLVGFEK